MIMIATKKGLIGLNNNESTLKNQTKRRERKEVRKESR
jgi:hypothetical protein